MVSVDMITYGHEKYIRQAIEGVLMQQTNFEVEIIIADDCSPDRTKDIVEDIINNHPRGNIIKYFRHNKNLGMQANGMFAVQQCTGKYIALCEGDDYWTDPLKLQKQVDVLEQHLNINICSHPSLRLYGDDLKKDGYGFWGEKPKVISAEDVIIKFSATAPLQTIMFRNQNLNDFCGILKELLEGHSTIQMFYSMPNGLYYLPDYMSVYRVGSSSSITKELFKNDKFYFEKQKLVWKGLEMLNSYSDFAFDKKFKDSLQLRILGTFGSGNLTFVQMAGLVREYKLYRNLKVLRRELLFSCYIKLRRTYRSILSNTK